MTLLFVSIALALPLELQLSPGGRVEVLTSANPGHVDVLVHENQIDLGPQVGWTVGTGIARVQVWQRGGGQVLALTLTDPGTAVVVRATEGGAALVVVPRVAPLALVAGARSGAEALIGKFDGSVCVSSPPNPAPLSGADSRWSLDAMAEPPALPEWSAGEPSVVQWTEVWDTRRLLAQAKTAGEHERLMYRLAALLRALGHEREAAYYFDRSGAVGGAHAVAARFQAARARMNVKDWEGARRSARDAEAAGGAPEMVLVAMLWAEMQSEGKDLRGMARAVASTDLSGEHRRLVGVALSRAGCESEAVALLALPPTQPASPDDAVGRLLLADSQLRAGDIDAARRGYAEVSEHDLPAAFGPLLRTRTRHLAVLALPTSRWGSLVPDLQRASKLPGDAGEESLNLLAQVSAVLGLEREAVEAWASLVFRAPRLAAGPVGASLTAAWTRRSERLLTEGRRMDALALHRAVGSETLVLHLADSSPLHPIARAYAEAGLSEQAQATWRFAAELERRRGIDSRPTVMAMAGLYVRTRGYRDALDAVDWLRRHNAPELDGHLAWLEALAAEGRGDLERARARFKSLERSPGFAVQARLRLAILDAREGRCEEALPELEVAAESPPAGSDGIVVQETLLRCLLATGRTAAAADAAVAVAGLASDGDVRAWAGSRASRLESDAGRTVNPLFAQATGADPSIWGALAREEEAQRVLGAELKQRRTP